jgi:DNA-binding transcriptional ArsR family regulator
VAKDSAARRRATENDERRPSAAGAPQLRPVPGAGAGAENASDEGALGLDRLIHERMRLGIVSALAANDSMTFNDLKLLLGTTDGNLSVHARKLEDAKYITCTKSFEGRMPRTEYKLTADGRRALKRYVDHMEALIRAIRER